MLNQMSFTNRLLETLGSILETPGLDVRGSRNDFLEILEQFEAFAFRLSRHALRLPRCKLLIVLASSLQVASAGCAKRKQSAGVHPLTRVKRKFTDL